MTLQFFSFTHILILLVAAGIVLLLYFLFKNSEETTRRNFIILLMSLNIIQHFFKHILYPHIFAGGLHLDNTAYNICAFLILFSPLFHFGKSESARQYIAYVGTVSGALALIVPFWFFGKNIFAAGVIWEFIRFFLCHELLFVTSLLPVLWGRVRFRHGDGWKFGLYFIGMLCAILLNNTVFLLMTDTTAPDHLYQSLLAANPAGIMGPPAYNSPFNVLIKAVEALSPVVFLGGAGKVYTPILWYAIPLYYGITLIALALGAITDRKNFIADFRAVFLHKGTPPERNKLPVSPRVRKSNCNFEGFFNE